MSENTQTENAGIPWEPKAQEKYTAMLSKIPLFHREITQQVVDKQAVINAQQRGSDIVEEKDILKSFFADVPKTFYSLMIRLMDEVGFDYKEFDK